MANYNKAEYCIKSTWKCSGCNTSCCNYTKLAKEPYEFRLGIKKVVFNMNGK